MSTNLIGSEINHYWVHFHAGHSKDSLIHPTAIVKCYHDDDFVPLQTYYRQWI